MKICCNFVRDQLAALKKSLAAGRSESAELLRGISERKQLLESINAEYNYIENDLSQLKIKHAEGKQLLDRLEVCCCILLFRTVYSRLADLSICVYIDPVLGCSSCQFWCGFLSY